MHLSLAVVVWRSASKWQKFKVQILAYFANRLRAQLVKEREKSAELELELARAQVRQAWVTGAR